MKYAVLIISLLATASLMGQSLEIKNESRSRCVKIMADIGGTPVAGEEYTIKGLVNPENVVKFIYKRGDKVIRAEDHTRDIKDGVKWVAKEGETLLILIKDIV